LIVYSPYFLTNQENNMITAGQTLPAGKLMESTSFDEQTGCPVGPQEVDVTAAARDKKIVIFGLPGAYTPTCSAKHVPGFVANAAALKAKGVDEVWCVTSNDAFVMAAWGKHLNVNGTVRMLADGSVKFIKDLGLELDLTARGMGVRSNRYAMIVDSGVVKGVYVEAPGKFEVSSAEAVLAQL
jgi:peroxiredoxin